MKQASVWLLMAGAALLTTACDRVGKALFSEDSCSSAVAAKTMREMLVDAAEESARQENKSNADNPNALRFDLAKIRALAAEVGFDLEDVITTKKDPNSTKKFCEAQLTLSLPSAVLDDANALLQEYGLPSVQAEAEDEGFRVDLGKFKSKISYSVQPTDAGDKLYTEVDAFSRYSDLVATTVQYAALKALRVPSQGSATQQLQEKMQQEQADTEELANMAVAEHVQPGFDCAKASTLIESLICSDNDLARLDAEMTDAYRGIIHLYEGNYLDSSDLKATQRQWLKEQRNVCKDRACLERAYHARLEELSWAGQLGE